MRIWQIKKQKAKGKNQKSKIEESRRVGIAHRKWTVIAVTGLVLLTATILTVRYRPFSLNPRPLAPGPRAAPQALSLPDKPSIIVLPFTNLSGDQSQEYFSDGFTDELITDLSRIPQLFIIARQSAFTYKGKQTKVQDISREMGVHYVLEGSVQQAKEQLRVLVQLSDATTGEQVWAERYDRPVQELFTLHDEIVRKIVTTLKLQLSLQEQGFRIRKTTNNLEAYDYFLRGMEQYSRFTKEGTMRARQMFDKAVALDPQYAEAYVGLGRAYMREWLFGWSITPQTLGQAFVLAQQALTLDDSSPFAHSLLSWGLALNQQYDQAVAEIERAIALDPNNNESYSRQADVLLLAGRPEEAMHSLEKAMRVNPYYPAWDLISLGSAYLWTGKPEEAVAVLKEAVSRIPSHSVALGTLATSLIAQWTSQRADSQALVEALAAAQRLVSLNDSYFGSHWILGTVYLFQKQREQAIAESERTIALSPEWADGYAMLALALSGAGKHDGETVKNGTTIKRKSLAPRT